MKTKLINVEEDGEDVFPETKVCLMWKCNIETNYIKAPLVINKQGFKVCSHCGVSYGKTNRKTKRKE